jgi:hypothetical protein
MKHGLNVDVLACPCGHRMKYVATIFDRKGLARLLRAKGLPLSPIERRTHHSQRRIHTPRGARRLEEHTIHARRIRQRPAGSLERLCSRGGIAITWRPPPPGRRHPAS